MKRKMPFDFEIEVDFFEKADADKGKQRRIGGLASIETRDRQQEILLQRGLDFGEFLSNGWFNDNHSKKTADILGYPDVAQYVRKGSVLPNGQKAKADGHWVEGYLLDTDPADEIWKLGKALQKTNRRLGFSVEGKILSRDEMDQRKVAKAIVRNVAITNCPVNTDATMEVLAKSLQSFEASDEDIEERVEKALSMGSVATPGVTPSGPVTGEGAGQILSPESLEREEDLEELKKKKNTKQGKSKSLTKAEAMVWLRTKLPNATDAQLERVINLTRRFKKRGEF